MYSREDIEIKRQQALQRKNQRASSDNSVQKESTAISKNVTENQIQFNKTANSKNIPSFNYGSTNKYASNFGIFSTNKNHYNKSQSTIKLMSKLNRFNPVANTNKFYGSKQVQLEVNCSMISNNRFNVEMSLFNKELIDVFKTIPTSLYDSKTKIWNFHISDYDMLRDKIVGLEFAVVWNGLPSFVLKVFRRMLQEKEQKKVNDLSDIDPILLNSLYPFQKQGIEYGIQMNGRCLLADDMGLGKTRQALGIAAYYKKNWPLIIVTPSSLKYQWVENIIENIPSVPVHYIQHIVTAKDDIEKNQVLILSYDLLVRKIDSILSRKYGVIICDESHYLKSGKTQRTKAVQRLVANCKQVILLTGTPALSRPIELYSQIKLLIPNFMNYQDFGKRYCGGVQTTFGWNFMGSTNSKELEILLKACCCIRRLKSEVLVQLPLKIRESIVLDPYLIKVKTNEMKAASNLVDKSFDSIEKNKALLEYYALTSKVKEKAVCNYVCDLLENQQKFLIFAHHQNMLDAISDLLTSKKILFIRIDGKTNSHQRKTSVDMFQQDDKVLVAVLSITTANAGITMTSASLVIFAELSWNPGILAQAEDRVHRIGQTDNVVIRYLLAKNTADDYMWPAIKKKTEILNEVGLDQKFNFNEVNVSNQSPILTNQKQFDSYLEISRANSDHNETVNANLQKSSESFKDLLDIDDDAFDDINLDNIT